VSIQASYIVPCFSIFRIYLHSTTKSIHSLLKIFILYEQNKTTADACSTWLFFAKMNIKNVHLLWYEPPNILKHLQRKNAHTMKCTQLLRWTEVRDQVEDKLWEQKNMLSVGTINIKASTALTSPARCQFSNSIFLSLDSETYNLEYTWAYPRLSLSYTYKVYNSNRRNLRLAFSRIMIIPFA
jgi:hypothetical protein